MRKDALGRLFALFLYYEMLGYASDENGGGFAEYERVDIFEAFVRDIVSALVYKLAGNAANRICYAADILALGINGVVCRIRAHKGHHLAGFALGSALYSRLAYHDGFVKVGFGSDMRSATLGQIQLNGANLAAEFFLYGKLKGLGCSGELLVTESVEIAVFLPSPTYVPSLRCIPSETATTTFGWVSSAFAISSKNSS